MTATSRRTPLTRKYRGRGSRKAPNVAIGAFARVEERVVRYPIAFCAHQHSMHHAFASRSESIAKAFHPGLRPSAASAPILYEPGQTPRGRHCARSQRPRSPPLPTPAQCAGCGSGRQTQRRFPWRYPLSARVSLRVL